MNETAFIWMNGELRPWADATVHVGSHALHYGTGVFEGIRAYDGERGTGIFRLDDHLRRLQRSGELYYMPLPFTVDELRDAVWQTITANELDACYVRPIAFRGYEQLGLYPMNCPVDVAIMVWPWGTYLGDDALEHGITAKVSSIQRFGPNVLPPAAKATGQYLNSILAKLEVTFAGYEEAILLNERGNVSEGSGENLFVVREGRVLTPPLSDSILPGITRDSVIRIARDLGYEVSEQSLVRQDLYTCDELFMTGTAAELTPVRAVDDHPIGEPGPVTRRLQEAFFDTARGLDTPWSDLMEYPAPSTAAAGDASAREAS